ncbi:DNA sulfur modification protein DndD [Tolumonas auensis DSM 9187]|uniref:DNA sulfur modification protein DndD n=1 Tax=Tolumonas auensis (strain DSM 9187 / NBRC 110442 / TA 4) TaxID=595494 RepID=C4LF31_TOLAT|nr:DNA sulfur modification protein DndD [Tolumonas auensis]ACQ93198.1 DNA sulfur modification protein DndD [Tolumonas auensis DSM 9187]
MLITKLSLNNFRVFCGLHEIDLTPSSAAHNAKGEEIPGTERSIILFGGLNGAGKTSILTAVRLALYGRLSFGKPLHNNEYIEELSELIHKGNGINSPENAYIELAFTHNQAGSENTYKVTRSWKKGKADKLILEQDGKDLSELSYDQCQGFLNELIPNGIADLFFFDGEKIAELAEDESGTILNTAVKRLLGLDVIAKLKSDLNIYLKKQGATLLETSIKQQLDNLDETRIKHERNAEKLRHEANQVLIQIEHVSQEIQKLEAELSSSGGAWAETREQEEQKIDQLLKEKLELEKQIRMEMETSLPFALAPNSMKALLSQIEKERALKQKQHFAKELDGFLDTLRKDLSFRLADSNVAMDAIADCFNYYVSDDSNQALLLDISDRQANAIEYQVNQSSHRSYERFDKARSRLGQVEELLDNISQNVARAPEKEQLQGTLDKIRARDKKKQELCSDYQALLEDAKQELRLALETARQIQKLHDKHRDNANKNASVENAQNTILLLSKFADQLTKSRVKSLEQHFVESYKKLARKEDLQLCALINPKSFDVELIDEHGNKINRKAMSAGEKQIYAISILEALGKTSGRKLPIIIDTPLGRLDSHHRDKLVENYFPTASHQVVILSTDTEIDKDYIRLIEDDIAKTYEICFDGKSKSSHIKQGYFWKQVIQEAV